MTRHKDSRRAQAAAEKDSAIKDLGDRILSAIRNDEIPTFLTTPISEDDPPFFAATIRRGIEETKLIDPFTVAGPRRIAHHLRDPQLVWGRKRDRMMMERIISRDYRTCYICGRTMREDEPVCIDHIIPRSLGGRNTDDNLGVLCPHCNMQKGERLTCKRPSALGDTLSVEEAIKAASG